MEAEFLDGRYVDQALYAELEHEWREATCGPRPYAVWRSRFFGRRFW